MSGTEFTVDQLKSFLLNNGYLQDDIDKNFETYSDNFFTNLMSHFLNQLSQPDYDTLIGASNLDSDEGCQEVLKKIKDKLDKKEIGFIPPSQEQLLSFIKTIE